MSTVEQKPPIGQLEITIRDQTGSDVKFRVKVTTSFKKVFAAYCANKQLVRENVRFVYESNRVVDDETPAQRGVEDGDVIDAMVEQRGGC